MHLRDAKPQVLFLESEADCNLVCLNPSAHIPVLQGLPWGCEPGIVWLRKHWLSYTPSKDSQADWGPPSPPPKSALTQAGWAIVILRYEWCAHGRLIDRSGEMRGGSIEGLVFELSCECVVEASKQGGAE